MELDLEQALEKSVSVSGRLEISPDRLGRPELLSLSPVRFEGLLAKLETGFHLGGDIAISGVVACSRCLKEVPFARASTVAWRFSPKHEQPSTEDEVELGASDLEVVWYEDFVVPFDPLVDEQVQLEIPMKPLCREDCRGLCPQCGVDRNVTGCACSAPDDDRWQPLRALLAKQ